MPSAAVVLCEMIQKDPFKKKENTDISNLFVRIVNQYPANFLEMNGALTVLNALVKKGTDPALSLVAKVIDSRPAAFLEKPWAYEILNAMTRREYFGPVTRLVSTSVQSFLGMTGGWSVLFALIKKAALKRAAEVTKTTAVKSGEVMKDQNPLTPVEELIRKKPKELLGMPYASKVLCALIEQGYLELFQQLIGAAPKEFLKMEGLWDVLNALVAKKESDYAVQFLNENKAVLDELAGSGELDPRLKALRDNGCNAQNLADAVDAYIN